MAEQPNKEQVPQQPQKQEEGKDDFSVEQAFEGVPAPSEVKEPKAPAAQIPAPASIPQTDTPQVTSRKSETLHRIEDIMSEDMTAIYKELPPDVKAQFKEQGEVVAKEVEGMMFKVKVHSKTVFKLVFGWLRIIPHVNKYFLRQEAKLKTDELMKLKDQVDTEQKNVV